MCARPSDPNAKIDLLRAAEAIFVVHGLERAKVEEITSRAGRSKGSFYLHFKSKEDAFRQIVESMLARLASFLDRAGPECIDPPSSVDELLARWHQSDVEIFEFIWQNRGVARLAFEGGSSARFAYLMDEFAERARCHIREMLAEGVRRGFYRKSLHLEMASFVIAGAYDRVGRQIVHMQERPDLSGWLRDMQRLVLVGIIDDRVRPLVRDQLVNCAGPAPARGRKVSGSRGATTRRRPRG